MTSTLAQAPPWVQSYEQKLPGFTRRLRETIHVPEDHPMYRAYYDYAFWRFEQGRELSNLFQDLGSLDGATLLDIGSGAGGVSAMVATAGARVVSLDVAWGFLRLSRQAYKDLGVHPLSLFASGEKIPLGDASCDWILAMDILEHVPDPLAMFDEIARCLKPGGKVCLQTGYRYDWKNIRRDPHYGLPGVILLPRFLREWIVVHLTRRNPELEDFYWFKSYKEVFEHFARRGIVLHHEGGVLVGTRLEASKVVVGTEGDRWHLDGDPTKDEGFFGPEESQGRPMRWSRKRSQVHLHRKPEHREAVVELASLRPDPQQRPQSLRIRCQGGPWIKMKLNHNNWVECQVPLGSSSPVPGLCTLELRVEPTWSPTELNIPDTRQLGVAVHSITLR